MFEIRKDLLLEEFIVLFNENNQRLIDSTTKKRLIFNAAMNGNFEVVKYITENTVENLNICDEAHRSTLHYAMSSNNLDLIRYLIEIVGLDPLMPDDFGETPFEIANKSNDKFIISYLNNFVGFSITETYKNPIRPGFFPDPSIVRVRDDYYLVNSTFTYYPCITISHSKDLVNWKIIGHALTDPEEFNLEGLESGLGFWAPDISYFGNKYYITATFVSGTAIAMTFEQIIFEGDSPHESFKVVGRIPENGIDPSLFVDDDGKLYMLLNRGAKIFEIDKYTFEKSGETKLLWYGDYKEVSEGPQLMKHHDDYYLLVSEGGTGVGHRISVARSKSLWGPYESCPYNPIMRQKDPIAMIQRAGHGKIVKTEQDEWYIVYLASRRINKKFSLLGRETFMDKLIWTSDGWPMINNNRGPSIIAKKPGLSLEKKADKSEALGYREQQLHEMKSPLDWLWVRKENIEVKGFSTGEPFDFIGGKNQPKCKADTSIYVTRQTFINEQIILTIQLLEMHDEQEIGSICYYDENSYIKFGIIQLKNQKYIMVIKSINQLDTVLVQTPIELGENEIVNLKIIAQGLKRSFFLSTKLKEENKICEINNTYYLSDEGLEGLRFTGAMHGIYGTSGDIKEKVRAKVINYQVAKLDI